MTDLDKLIDAIEAGTLTDIGQEWRLAAMPREWWEPIVKSNSGSLDAAKALHGELLSGWGWEAGVNATFVCIAQVWKSGRDAAFSATAEDPARALLLATLKAFRATQEANQ